MLTRQAIDNWDKPFYQVISQMDDGQFIAGFLIWAGLSYKIAVLIA